jgi:hypothetical protein
MRLEAPSALSAKMVREMVRGPAQSVVQPPRTTDRGPKEDLDRRALGQLSVGLLQPSAGSIAVLDGRPGTTPDQLARVGFVAQDTPTYALRHQYA